MKKTTFLWTVLLSIFLSSCQKEDELTPKKTGSLTLNIRSALQVNEVNRHLKSAPLIEDFKVTIYHSDGSELMTFDSTSVRPDTIELEVGDYYVEAYSENNLPAAFDNPYYYGISEIFSIGPNTQQTVVVNCILANTIVTVLYTQQVVNGFTDFACTVSSALDSLVFQRDEIRKGYFQPLPLSIRVSLDYEKPDGTEVVRTLSGSIPFPLANRHYEILVDASIFEGLAAFQIFMDSTEVPVEVIDISDDPVDPVQGSYAYGDLLITEIMYNPTSLSDTEGEWFEVYNNSDQTINLQNLILGRDDANRHIIVDPIDLQPGAYLVFERADTATSVSLSYTFGSDLLLPNAGAVLSIFNEGTETEPGPLIFSVDYGANNFPDGSGASIALNPDRLNAPEAILAGSWCISSTVYNTGDLGSPGDANDDCQ